MTAPQAVPRVRSNRQTPPVHLARVGLRGFKSFPDPVQLRFEPGVAILVGPNGSGKSNVADAIVWASGSLSPTELRAEKPDDVLFAGAGERPAAAFCEVELVFDDAEGAGGLDFSTLAIARRLHRGGEGQYLLGGASVRRTDVVEVLAELGLGRSIVGQGRVEELLAERQGAEDELEDAAGRRESATAALYRMRSGAERLTVRSEAIGRLVEPLRRDAEESERAAADRPVGPTRAQLEAAAAAARAEQDAAAAAARVARERLATLERVLEEREGLPPAARALAERGERLVLSELDVAPGDERAVTAALGARASALVASDPQAALRLLDQAREAGLGGLTVVLERALR